MIDIDTADMSLCWKKYLQYLMEWSISHRDCRFTGMSPACFSEWIDNEAAEGKEQENLIIECDSQLCLFNPTGYCIVPILSGQQPVVIEDGCENFIFRGD